MKANLLKLAVGMSIGDACIPVFDISEEEYVNTPSRKDGIDEETECKLRIYGCELVQECGVLLRLYAASHPARLWLFWTEVESLTRNIDRRPQVTMATGQVIFHRFYFRQSFKRYDVRYVSLAALFLAAKIEETPKK